MSDVWIVSLVLAWVVIVLLVVVVLSLLRQLGALRALIGAGAPRRYDDVAEARLYDPVEPFTIEALDGTPVTIGGDGPPTLLAFHQPGCLECQEIPAVLAALETEARLVSVLTLDRRAAAGHATPGVPTVVVDDLPPPLRAPATPATIGITREGLVCVLGRAAGREQLQEAAHATVAAAMMAGPGSERLTEWGVCAPFFSRAGAAP